MNFTKNKMDVYQLWDHVSTSNVTSSNSSGRFQSTLSPVIDQAISGTVIVILFLTMISLGCTMEIAKIQDHIAKPKGLAVGAVAQYGIMPLAACVFAKLFRLGPMAAVTVLICGCCPGGNLSNIFTLGLQGDMNLSIVMTTFSTILALGMMPLLLFMYSQGLSNLESAVPYTGITLALVMTLVPCSIGITINHRTPRFSRTLVKVRRAASAHLSPSGHGGGSCAPYHPLQVLPKVQEA